MFNILLGVGSLFGFFFLGNVERHDMKLPPVAYWFTWIFGGIAGVGYVGTEIGGPAGFAIGVVLSGAYIGAVTWSIKKSVANEQQDSTGVK